MCTNERSQEKEASFILCKHHMQTLGHKYQKFLRKIKCKTEEGENNAGGHRWKQNKELRAVQRSHEFIDEEAKEKNFATGKCRGKYQIGVTSRKRRIHAISDPIQSTPTPPQTNTYELRMKKEGGKEKGEKTRREKTKKHTYRRKQPPKKPTCHGENSLRFPRRSIFPTAAYPPPAHSTAAPATAPPPVAVDSGFAPATAAPAAAADSTTCYCRPPSSTAGRATRAAAGPGPGPSKPRPSCGGNPSRRTSKTWKR